MSEASYYKTIRACFLGYVVQAIVGNFAPLLFLTFQNQYGISLSQITLLVTFNFGFQLLTDFLSARFLDRIGYRAAAVAAHILTAAGLLLLTVLPECMPSPFLGLLFSFMTYAIGGGLLEVIISPIVEACPTDNKEKAMSLLHSFYCWGYVGVVLLSTICFAVFGISHWKWIACLWAIVPAMNAVAFLRVPLVPLLKEGEQGMTMKELSREKLFWVLFVMMVCSGASEQVVSQWASAFAEQGLGVSKVVGDLAGPMAFAALMGISRTIYGKFGERMNLDACMIGSAALCILSYLVICLVPIPAVALGGCGLTGFSVGILWPGTFSKAAAALRRGGTVLFALLALGGDLGCACGPAVVGFVSGAFGENLRIGILAAVIFPVMLIAGVALCGGRKGGKEGGCR